jgi:hypothetical protein
MKDFHLNTNTSRILAFVGRRAAAKAALALLESSNSTLTGSP